ncbi:MAG: cation diffusion facilitator family transporter [Vulcanococcus sp.]
MSAHHHHHPHSHSQHHQHGHGPTAGAFRWSVLLNALLTGVQLAIGFGFGSLALIGDAIHNLGDVVGLLLGWGADHLSRRPASGRFTYGFGRSTHLAALINGLLVFAAGAVVAVEAIQRLRAPVAMEATPVAWAALAGIVINLASARLFGDSHQHDLNRRAAVLHLLTDAAVSAAVLLTALVVWLTGWMVLDALTALVVGVVVMASALGLLREALAASLDAAPLGLDLAAVEAALLALPGVQAVEELHVWNVSTSRIALTAHLRCDGASLSPSAPLLQLAEQRLQAFGIRKSTLQLEGESPPLKPDRQQHHHAGDHGHSA